MSELPVIILGAGPSGMMAAHAVAQYGREALILDKNPDQSRRSSGVYYIHSDCDLALDPVLIKQTVIGTSIPGGPDAIAKAYGDKVYGINSDTLKLSIIEAMKQPAVVGYNSNQAVDRLWDIYGSHIQKYDVNGYGNIKENFLDLGYEVISTIPLNVLAPEIECQWSTVTIEVGTAPEDEAIVFYNANPHFVWYRASAIFGVFTKEFNFGFEPSEREGYNYHTVRKVIGRSQDLPEIDNLFFVGRYGAWDKKYLTDTVYWETLRWMHERT